jgi:flagellar biosynthesis/type III secretory pathway protein FliH
MDMMVAGSSRIAGMLFAEDFDIEEPDVTLAPPPEPDVIEPHFSAADMEAVRDEAWSGGRQAGIAEANAGLAAALARAMAGIRLALIERNSEARECAERAGTGLARVLIASMAGVLPALCRDHGEAEARAVVQAILPELIREPAIAIRIHPRLSDAMREELLRLDPVLSPRVSVVATDAVAFGDVRIDWEDGTAQRDAAAMWRMVRGILVGADLLEPEHVKGELAHAG